MAERAGGSPGDWTDAECAYCGYPILILWDAAEPEFVALDAELRYPTGQGAHLDHVIAESRNGPTSIDNTVISCAPCNLAKGAASLGDPRFQRWLAARRAEVARVLIRAEAEKAARVAATEEVVW